MKVAYITAGAGGMICGNCLRDNALAAALIELGHDVRLIPTYTPIRTDQQDVSIGRVFYGGVNVYLQQKVALFRRTPRVVDWLLDRPALLRWVSKFAVRTQPEDLGELTVSVLEGALGNQRKELARLITWLKADPPDVVHLTNSMLLAIAPPVKAELEVPVCCSLQGEDYFLESLPAPYRERAFDAIRRQAGSVDAFLSPCRDHASAMAPHLGMPEEDIHVVLPGLNPSGFAPGGKPHPGEFRIGYLGRVCPEKGLDLLVEACRIIRKRQDAPWVRLQAAGWLGAEHRGFLAEVQREAAAAGMQDDFKYLGTLDRDEKIRFLQGLDALSVPVNYRAPKGQYVLEAWACGVPVVQPRLGVFPELIDVAQGGLLFEPENAEDLAAKLENLIDDPEQARRMGERGRQAVQTRFHSRRLAEETIQVHERILAAAGGVGQSASPTV